MRSADVALAVRANAWSTGSRSSSSIAASAGVAQARQRARAAAMRGQRGANDFDITCSGFLSAGVRRDLGGNQFQAGRQAGGDDRKSVVKGKSVSVRVVLGGRRFIKKKQKKTV